MISQPQISAKRGLHTFSVLLMILWILTVVFGWFFPERGAILASHIVTPVLLMCSGAWLFSRGKSLRTTEWLMLAFTGWYILTRVLNGNHYLETDYDFVCQLIATTCIAFPLAESLEGKQRDNALKALAGVVVALFSAIAWIAVVASITHHPFQLPLSNRVIGVNGIYTNPSRLNVLDMHPNISGALFCMGMGLTLYLCVALRSKWWLLLLLPAALGLFAAVALTLSRTAMVVLSCQIGGIVYLILMKKLRFSRRWLKPAVSLLVFAALSAASFMGLYQSIFVMDALSSAVEGQSPTAAAVSTLPSPTATAVPSATTYPDTASIVDQSRLEENVTTFAGRLSDIYPAVIPVLKERPITLLIGNSTDKVITAANRLTGRYLYHWHNSLIQTLMTAGLPALLFALAFSALLIIQCARLILCPDVPLPVQALVIPVAGVFLHSMLENLLFVNVQLSNLLFMLLCGFIFAYTQTLRPRLRSK
jgi:O-antigen ligase